MSIFFEKETKTFYLDGKGITYAFFINDNGYAEHLYYGKSIGHDDLSFSRSFGAMSCRALVPGCKHRASYHHFATELSFFGTGDYREPTVAVQNEQGDMLTELLYDGYDIIEAKPAIGGMPSLRDGQTLVVHLSDRVTDLACDLYYTVYDDCGVIARRAVYKNGNKQDMTLTRAYSFAMSLQENDYDAITLHGAWARECQIDRTPLHYGVFSIDSKRASSSATINPFMAILKKDATESHGEAWGVSLIYSSSFVLKAEGTSDGNTLITGGINDFGFSWKLGKGEYLETPEVVIAYSGDGLGGMSRELHRAYRNHLINPRYVKNDRPIVINNWEGTYFEFDNEKLKAIASAVKDTGIDTFVLDDGWFGNRSDDTSSLGDWFINTEKLEGGLKTIIDHVNSIGMKFGLWFEPEMVSENSELFRTHPDYAIGVPNRPRCYSRNQYMLDLTRADVRDYIVNAVNKILHENKIEYVKWDYNRNVTEFFSHQLPNDRQGEFAHRYALGVYDLFERIVEANPNVFFEGCSSGGARFDAGVLYYFPQIWTSDDSDAEERTHIQYGTSLAYPLSTMSCHVSIVPNHQTGRITDMTTRADIAHLGATGYELDTTTFTDEDKEQIKKQIADYKNISDLILNGDLWRIDDPQTSNFFGFMVVSEDKKQGFLTVYRRMGSVNNPTKYFKPAGLDKDTMYRIDELGITVKGSTVMNLGLPIRIPMGDFKTSTYHFTAVK